MTNGSIRILWTSNIDLPSVSADLGLESTPFGGWITQSICRLARNPEFEIGIAMRSESRVFRRIDKEGIAYFALPQTRSRFDVAQAHVDSVLAEYRPDILHIEGAEMRHARRFLSSFAGPKILSMQGVLNGYARYELGRLPIVRMLNPFNPRISLTALALLVQRQILFMPRLKSERKAMQLATHVMGRTIWDRAQASVLSPDASYHHCSRILRDEFYTRNWAFESMEPFSIFLGNSASARKGAHIAVKGLSFLVSEFPQVRLCIAGEDPRRLPWRSASRHVGYPVYLLHLIRKLGLEDRVHFTGILSGEQMAERMVGSHVCVMSSIIENSPNTLGEAMILGVPTVSAYAGGAPSMARDELETLFYRADDPAMLAMQVRRVFMDAALAGRLSSRGRAKALKTHDPKRNIADLVNAYQSIAAEQSDSIR